VTWSNDQSGRLRNHGAIHRRIVCRTVGAGKLLPQALGRIRLCPSAAADGRNAVDSQSLTRGSCRLMPS
jgi:hypothetical protein